MFAKTKFFQKLLFNPKTNSIISANPKPIFKIFSILKSGDKAQLIYERKNANNKELHCSFKIRYPTQNQAQKQNKSSEIKSATMVKTRYNNEYKSAKKLIKSKNSSTFRPFEQSRQDMNKHRNTYYKFQKPLKKISIKLT